MADQRRSLVADVEYAPFIILSGERTGSTLLARALDSNTTVRCFGEVFNFVLPFIDYSVEGYDSGSEADYNLRNNDPTRFLRERIFCNQPERIDAVGFKFHYQHFWKYPGLWQALAEDSPIRVIHLQRRNLLRMCVSTRIAEQTGVWQDRRPTPRQRASAVAKKLTPANAVAAVLKPAKALTTLRRSITPQPLFKKGERQPLTLDPEDLATFFEQTNLATSHFSDLFKDHPTFDLTYEDMTADFDGTFAQAQDFLGVECQKLTIANRRQNPEPLSELVANYDELRNAFRDHPNAWMFDD